MFSREEFLQFLRDYEVTTARRRLIKLICIFAIFGALRSSEVVQLTWEDVTYLNGDLFVKVNRAKNGGQASFLIPRKIGEYEVGPDWKSYVDKVPHKKDRIWFTPNRARDSYTDQYVGRNSIGGYAAEIAEFLEKENSSEFTGHAFRRTSATILADLGATILDLKRHGSWKSDSVAEGYVAQSLDAKQKIASKISGNKPNNNDEAQIILPPIDVSKQGSPATVMYFNNCNVNVVQDPNILK